MFITKEGTIYIEWIKQNQKGSEERETKVRRETISRGAGTQGGCGGSFLILVFPWLRLLSEDFRQEVGSQSRDLRI